jgi:hypothetical protein
MTATHLSEALTEYEAARAHLTWLCSPEGASRLTHWEIRNASERTDKAADALAAAVKAMLQGPLHNY